MRMNYAGWMVEERRRGREGSLDQPVAVIELSKSEVHH